jgi:RNA polymerase sigma-70 factor (ECF subfamily)
VAEGDVERQGFERWYLESRAALLAAAYFYVGSMQDAADLTQETYARAWQHWDQVSRHANREAWSRQVLHNLVVARWRRLRLERSRPAVVLSAMEPPDATHIDLARLVARLPANQRRALILHDILDLRIDEVAAEMKAPAGTVRSWLSRGRATLLAQRESPPTPVTREQPVNE